MYYDTYVQYIAVRQLKYNVPKIKIQQTYPGYFVGAPCYKNTAIRIESTAKNLNASRDSWWRSRNSRPWSWNIYKYERILK